MKIIEQENTTYLSIFRQGKRTLIIFAILGLLIGFVFSITKPLQYRSQASVLVIPDPRVNQDGYQATKSAEKYALTLSSVMPTMSFYNKVIAQNPAIAVLFSKDQNKQRKEWQRDIQVQAVPETGILRLAVYNHEKENAQEILTSVVSVLEKEGPAYLGGNSAVMIYMIDSPLATSIPVRPNYPLNMLGGIVTGLLVGAVIVFVRAESGSEKNIEAGESKVEVAKIYPAIASQNNFSQETETKIQLGPAFSQAQTRPANYEKRSEYKKPDYSVPRTETRTMPRPIPFVASQEPWITVTEQNKSQQF